MTPMQSRTNKLTLILLCCLALTGFAGLDLCRDSGGGDRRPTMQIQPPTAPVARGAIPDQTVVEGGTETLDVEPYFTDPDGDGLTYTVAVLSGASAATVTVSGSVVTIRGLVAGTAGVRVTATDPGGLTAEQDFDVRVEAVVVASPPVARGAIPDQTVVEGGTETLDVEPYFTDPDGDGLTYTVAVLSGASAATVTVSGSVVTIRGLVAGTAGVRVTATDPGGLTAEQDFDVRVEAVVEIPPPVVSPPAASPPVAQGIPDQAIVEGIPGTLDVEPYFTDPDSSSLTYNAVSGDPSVVTVAVSGSVVTMSGPLGATTAVVRVTATDPGGLSAYSDFTVVVLVQTQ